MKRPKKPGHSSSTAKISTKSAGASKKVKAIAHLVEQIPRVVHALTAKGRELSTVEFQGEGYLGVLRLLNSEGPQTVPQIARQRGVSRQRIQKLANTMADNGLVQFVENPAHQSSNLVQLTKAGKNHEDTLNQLFSRYAEQQLEPCFSLREIESTLDVLLRLQRILEN